jgi:hypothetical protein
MSLAMGSLLVLHASAGVDCTATMTTVPVASQNGGEHQAENEPVHGYPAGAAPRRLTFAQSRAPP